MYDVTVIGGGVVGCLILKELSRFNVKSLLLEKSDDVSTGASCANSGIVHAGYDAKPGTLMAKFNVMGNAMFPSLTEELHVPFKRTGSLVVARQGQEKGLEVLLDRAKQNGVPASIISREEILKIEPNVSDEIVSALYAPTAGIVSPYKLTIKAADFAAQNGAEVRLESGVTAIKKTADGFEVKTEKGIVKTKVLINAAGAGAIDINAMLGEKTPEAIYKKGEYFVLDKTEGDRVNTVIFPLPDENGKGMLVAPTADGNVIYGPTATPCSNDDTSVDADGLNKIRQSVGRMYNQPHFNKSIRVFAGIRAAVGKDFIIEEGNNKGFIMLLGICSPGLTSAPAIAKYVVGELVARHIALKEKFALEPLKKPEYVRQATPERISELVKEDPRWGRIICRCETVSEMEIVNAIHSPVPATTVDAVKRRVRAGMGRCQGGFCMPKVIEILARELKVDLTAVKKGGDGSQIALGKVEEVVYED